MRDKDDKEVGAYTYDAYGNVLTVEGDLAKANPIRYAGYYYDDETKNYYLQARYYNPANGAFLAEHRLRSARPVRTSMTLTSCEAHIRVMMTNRYHKMVIAMRMVIQ
ncbi:RHS repeat-associated core domain-containing protein [Kurthia sp. FSL E2-0154]|uniref:RHS repeat-associated core domain-containing protein n=1 Tax=Kurthia sp. FSL E2-0154 TaxID=2921358 RepID=UPI0030F9612D